MHSPHMRSFTCNRCSTTFSNYNPSMPRTQSSHQCYSSLIADPSRPKAPWRCIVEACAFTVCEPCSVQVHAQLTRLQELAATGASADVVAAERATLEKDGGRLGPSKDGDEVWDLRRESRKAMLAVTNAAAEAPIEVDDSIEADDNDGEEYSLEILKRERPWTRSAAAYSGVMTGRNRAPIPGVRRTREPKGD